MLFAVVYIDRPGEIVKETGAPFEGRTLGQAAEEVISTYGARLPFEQRWTIVPLTEELRKQYEVLDPRKGDSR